MKGRPRPARGMRNLGLTGHPGRSPANDTGWLTRAGFKSLKLPLQSSKRGPSHREALVSLSRGAGSRPQREPTHGPLCVMAPWF